MHKGRVSCFACAVAAVVLAQSTLADVLWLNVVRNGYARFEPGATRVWSHHERVATEWTAEILDGGVPVGQTRALVDSGAIEENRFLSAMTGSGWMNPGVQGAMRLDAGDEIEFDIVSDTPVRVEARLHRQGGSASQLLQELSETAQIVGIPTINRTFSVSAGSTDRHVVFPGVLKPGRYRYSASGGLLVQAGGGPAFEFSAGIVLGPHDLVAGVSMITSAGSPGALFTRGGQWIAIASGDDDSTFPSTVVAAREYGDGRVVLLGHEGLLTEIAPLDNAVFQRNSVRWLNNAGGKTIGITSGHSEWVSFSQLAPLRAQMGAEGFTSELVTAPITPAKLQAVSVLVVGNAWGSFTTDEVAAIEQWTASGGGLLLAGLGWSWLQYHPDTTLADYPMAKLGNPYGAFWLPGSIIDPTHQYQGSPVFHQLYPIALNTSVDWAMATIPADHRTYAAALPSTLESDSAVGLRFTRAHEILSLPARVLPEGDTERVRVEDFYATLFSQYPDTYRRIAPISAGSTPTAVWVRERAFATALDYGDRSPGDDGAVAERSGTAGLYRELLVNEGVGVLDNLRLNEPQKQYLLDFFSLLPPELGRPRTITVLDFLGTRPAPLSLSSSSFSVNIFGVRIGEQVENQFPPDVPPGVTDLFCSVLAHEANHIVDAAYIRSRPELQAKRDLLLAQAGLEPLNYLRSMFPSGFFTQNPQEFVASISNQWFADSQKTFSLGLVRFDAGRPEPLHQALFFAELYSLGTSRVSMYDVSPAGAITRRFGPVRRDDQGRIVEIALAAERILLDLDAEGNVVGYRSYCVADLIADGVVDFSDYLEFLNLFDAQDPMADLNMDGIVDFPDYLEFLTFFDGGC